MSPLSSHNIFKSLLLLLLVAFCYLHLAAFAEAANYPLEIIQPRAGLTIKNRFYKAYPGLEYNVRIGCIGGLYPYTYALTSAPTGMTIDKNTGVIIWPNPPASSLPVNVSVEVTDQEGTKTKVTWPITVTTTGFLFLDAVNGKAASSGGAGTLTNPFKTMNDFFKGDKYNSTYADYFVYWRNGTYFVDTPVEDQGRVPFVADYKPQVWLAYPGENPVIDYRKIVDQSIIFYSGNDNVYLDGLEFKNMLSYGVQVESNQPGMVFRRLKLHELGTSPGANNQSFIRVLANGQGNYLTIQDCEMYNLNHGCAIKLYQTNKTLIEDNLIHDFVDCEGIAIKQDITRTTVRHNKIYNVPNHSIGGNMNNTHWTSQDNEILFNRVWGDCSIAVNQNGVAGLMYYYRNTFECPIVILQPGPGPFIFSRNVIQTSSTFSGTLTNVVQSANLTGPSGIVDPNGSLTSNYSSYVGQVGWQITATPTATRIISGQVCDDKGTCRPLFQ